MPIKPILCATLLLPLATPLLANNHNLWLSYTENKADYFGTGASSLKPTGSSIGYSLTFAEAWQVSLSYGESDGEGRWLIEGFDNPDFFDAAETKSESKSISLGWLGEDFGLDFTYGELESSERALTRIPIIAEGTDSEETIYSFSYNDFDGVDDWLFGWSFGLQYIDSESDNLQVVFIDPITSVATRFNQTSYSAFADFDISHSFEYDAFTVWPQLTVSWAAEISSDGEPLVLLTRGDQRVFVSQLNDRFINTFRTPDSGFWDLSLNFDWHNNWSTSIAFGKTISAPTDTQSITFDISVVF